MRLKITLKVLSLKLKAVWARIARHVLRKGEMLRQARTRVNGYLNY